MIRARCGSSTLTARGSHSGNGLVSYYINLILEGIGIHETNTKAAINGGLQIWNLCCAMTGSLLIDRLGRRPLFIISNVGMLIGMPLHPPLV